MVLLLCKWLLLFLLQQVQEYDVTFTSMAIIAILALLLLLGTPAAPGAGAVTLFTILTGMVIQMTLLFLLIH